MYDLIKGILLEMLVFGILIVILIILCVSLYVDLYLLSVLRWFFCSMSYGVYFVFD